MKIPSLLLRRLYTFGSLTPESDGVSFGLKNRLSDATFTRLTRVAIDGREIPTDDVTFVLREGRRIAASEVTPETPIAFPLRETMSVLLRGVELSQGKHPIEIAFESTPFGKLAFDVDDAMSTETPRRKKIPADYADDFRSEMVEARQRFAAEYAGRELPHLGHFSFDATDVQGNCEHFTGVAQIPIGLAGPLQVCGEHADGEFLIPLATTEGTLVASYNRGIKLMNLSGGVKTTVQRDAMQRAPVFVFDSAREARAFGDWVDEHMGPIREAAEATSRVAKLQYIDTFLVSKFAYLRFNYSTGDAAGQNMVGRATFGACGWIVDNNETIRRFYLESNLATDKKASMVNVMKTRGKRVTAEVVVPRDVLIANMRVEPESIHYHAGLGSIGALISGANNNGAHSPNAITAMFIATGQDVANVSESSAATVYTELTKDSDLYMSITLPSLIVATYGGGTSLPTQRECLEILGCHGKGKVRKFAEIVAAVVLAGELSLAAAISSLDWVSSHEQYGRNR